MATIMYLDDNLPMHQDHAKQAISIDRKVGDRSFARPRVSLLGSSFFVDDISEDLAHHRKSIKFLTYIVRKSLNRRFARQA